MRYRLVWLALVIHGQTACTRTSDRGSGSSGDPPRASRPNAVTFTRGPGGSATTKLGYGISVNPKSGLRREWITAHDSTLPADIEGTTGVRTVYSPGGAYSSGSYSYVASVPLRARDSLSAVEVRFILFDIWGDFIKTLSETEVEDVPAGAQRTFTPGWRVWDENEVSEHYASLAYVARVRTAAGRVYEANPEAIVAEARKLSERFAPEDLDPERRPKRDSSSARR